MKKKPMLPFGLYNLLACLLAAACAVLLCLCAQRAEERYYLKLDVSDDQLTRLSDYTLERLDALTEEVTLYSVCPPGADSTLLDLQRETLGRMAATCPQVRLETLDPIAQPQRLAALNGESQGVAEGTVFVRNAQGTRIIRLNPEDFLFSRRIGEDIYTIYCGEAQLIGAIDRACTLTPTGVWFLTGHGEKTPEDCALLALQLRSMGYEVHRGELGMIAPAPGDVLFLLDPRQDLSGAEALALSAFLDGGGRLVTALGAEASVLRLPTLEKVLSLYGLGYAPGWVVEHVEETAFYVDDPTLLRPSLTANPIVDALAGRLILPRSCALAAPEVRPGVTHTRLLETSPRAVRRAQVAEDAYTASPEDVSGTQLLALAAENSAGMRILQLASVDMLLDSSAMNSAAVLDASANLDFLADCVAWASAREVSASLDAGVKQLPAQLIVFNSQETQQQVSLLLLTALPLLLLVVMGVVLVKRRRL